jgi:DNA end-binding protein Ku
MAQAAWKGSIQFGLVVIPVALFPATESHAGPVLHLYHARDASRIRMRRVCETEDVEVPSEEVATDNSTGLPDGSSMIACRPAQYERACCGRRVWLR